MFLGYLGKLPGNGHLWFLTVLMACYAEMLLLLRMRIKSQQGSMDNTVHVNSHVISG